MKIICTKEEYEILESGADLCNIIKRNGGCVYSRDGRCDKCYKENIGWEITDEGDTNEIQD